MKNVNFKALTPYDTYGNDEVNIQKLGGVTTNFKLSNPLICK